MGVSAPADDDADQEPAEHRRFADHLRALASGPASEEASLVASVLCDEDVQMGQSAVARHMDLRAAELLTDARFTAWADLMATVVAHHGFLTRRLREWTLLRVVASGDAWRADELAAASDWFQRTAVASPQIDSPDVLGVLATRGRTRRVRNAAGQRMERPDRLPG